MLKYEKQINSLPINSKMYEPQLKELGLTDNEIRIYLLLLQEGTLNPTMVSQKLGLHRGYVYDVLERMQEKLVVNSILQNNKKTKRMKASAQKRALARSFCSKSARVLLKNVALWRYQIALLAFHIVRSPTANVFLLAVGVSIFIFYEINEKYKKLKFINNAKVPLLLCSPILALKGEVLRLAKLSVALSRN